MADQLRVNLEDLCRAGDAIAGHGETLHTMQQSCHSQAQQAQLGWVGSSARALSGLLDGWAVTSRTQLQHIGQHSADLHTAVARFLFLDDGGAATLGSIPADRPAGEQRLRPAHPVDE